MPPLPLASVLELAKARAIMPNVWGLCGTPKVASNLEAGTTVLDAPYTLHLRYHSFFELKLQERPAARRRSVAGALR